MTKLDWPLMVSSFTFADKLRIGKFLLTEPIWTYGAWVKRYEDMWVEQFGCKHAVMVSSGSAANEVIALRRKWELQRTGEWPRRNKVIFPVNTWISSVSVWINIGFEPVFVDVHRGTLNVTPETLESVFVKDKEGTIATVFYTALLGYSHGLDVCRMVANFYGARFLMDNCEASFSYYRDRGQTRSILTAATCSTSIFFSHFTTSGTEGGLIFTDSEDEADWFRMCRSHGLTRGMPDRYKNPDVSPDFDFYLLGSNYRSSNLQAYMASLDFKRALEFSQDQRRLLLYTVNDNLDKSKYARFGFSADLTHCLDVPLAIPILCRTKQHRTKVESHLKSIGVMTRPIIGGSLLSHTCFKGYGNPEDYPNAKWAHECGFYIGINKDVTMEMGSALTEELNTL